MHHTCTCRYLLTHIVHTCLSSRPRGGRLHWRRQVKSAQRAARARQRSAHFRYQGVHFRRGGGQVQLTQQDRLRGGNRVHVSQGTFTRSFTSTCTRVYSFIMHVDEDKHVLVDFWLVVYTCTCCIPAQQRRVDYRSGRRRCER